MTEHDEDTTNNDSSSNNETLSANDEPVSKKKEKSIYGGIPGKEDKKLPQMSSSKRRINKKRDSLQELAEKYRLPKIEADAKVDTNRKPSFQGLKMGDLERELVRRVIKGDYDWVSNCLSKAKEVLFSDWAGGITRTSILYAANNADAEMCKLLLRYGGKELLEFKDIKNRDVIWYAKRRGLDVASLKGIASFRGLVDCWNFKVLLKSKETDNTTSKSVAKTKSTDRYSANTTSQAANSKDRSGDKTGSDKGEKSGSLHPSHSAPQLLPPSGVSQGGSDSECGINPNDPKDGTSFANVVNKSRYQKALGMAKSTNTKSSKNQGLMQHSQSEAKFPPADGEIKLNSMDDASVVSTRACSSLGSTQQLTDIEKHTSIMDERELLADDHLPSEASTTMLKNEGGGNPFSTRHNRGTKGFSQEDRTASILEEYGTKKRYGHRLPKIVDPGKEAKAGAKKKLRK